ncbi:MAG: hypothetical protein P8X63_06065 [Desulfuromonadaceae bacterium]
MKKTISSLIVLLFLNVNAFAEVTPGGTGMLFGRNHSFNFTAPPGWVLDNESGVRQGVHMIFYPAGQTWAASPIIAYGQSATKNEQTQNVADQVRFTVENFMANGSPSHIANRQEPFSLPDGTIADIYFYEGDQWGNYEAVGYFDEKETINFLVYNAKNLELFEQNLPKFYELLSTYKNLYAEMENPAVFPEYLRYAKEDSGSTEGNAYEMRVTETIGPKMVDIIQGCLSYVGEHDVKPFDLVEKIEKNGRVSESYIMPHNALTTCFKGQLSQLAYPEHSFDRFYFHINLEFK